MIFLNKPEFPFRVSDLGLRVEGRRATLEPTSIGTYADFW